MSSRTNTFALAFAFAFAFESFAFAKDSKPATYLKELESRGLVDKTAATPELLAAEVRRADEELLAGRPQMAAARLYAIVEGPRYQDFSDNDDYQDAEYRLGLALARGGSSETARAYYERVLARGKDASYYHAALRAYVDVCLDEKKARACTDRLHALKAADLSEEIDYLEGRALFEEGRLTDAETLLGRVTAQSRFYSSALYLRGVSRVKQSDLRGAQDAFCAVADVKDGDTIRFYIDGRYYALRDLARLALGRVAHEEQRFDDAFYHYFLIPSDSDRLPEALFESAWSSLERREFDLGARLVEALAKQFPSSPRALETILLRATMEVKTCRFAEAEKHFDDFGKLYEPLTAEVDRAIADPTLARALAMRLLDGAAPSPTAVTSPTVESLLRLQLSDSARFRRLAQLRRSLATDASDAAHVVDTWRDLERAISQNRVQSVAGTVDASSLLERVTALGREIASARSGGKKSDVDKVLADLERRRKELVDTLERTLDADKAQGAASADKGLLAMAHADVYDARALHARVARLGEKFDAQAGLFARDALVELRTKLEGMLRRARLGKIDAVVGQKRKLERQIENLAQGKFPPEMFNRLHIEGLIADDEEYWPPEQERWADEYENYK